MPNLRDSLSEITEIDANFKGLHGELANSPGSLSRISLVREFSRLRRKSCQDILLDIFIEPALSNASQKRAIKNYRNRLRKQGMARFEVLGLDADRDLIRSLARLLAEKGPDASRLRSAVSLTMGGEPPVKGGILEALRRSPLVGADIAAGRRFESGRKVDL